MGQDKKSKLKQLLAFIQDLYDNPDYKDFAAGIQSFVLKDLRQEQRTEWSQQIADIYEYCLMKNLREQAEDLYKDFPMTDIAPRLVEHYVDMEESRRKNDFDGFGLNLYLQVELIVETLIKDPAIISAYDRIRNLPPVMGYDASSKSMVRVATYTYKKGDGGQKELITIDTVDKFLILNDANVGKPISELKALDKTRIIIYMLCYRARVDKYPTAFREDLDAILGIYNVRCHDSHSGVNSSPKQEQYYKAIVENKTKNYLRFLSFLLSFIKGISSNYPLQGDLV